MSRRLGRQNENRWVITGIGLLGKSMARSEKNEALAARIREAFAELSKDRTSRIETDRLRKSLIGLLVHSDAGANADLSRIVGELLMEMAKEHWAFGERYHPELATTLSHLAADLGCFEAAYDRAERGKQGIGPVRTPYGGLEEWLEVAFRQGLAEWGAQQAKSSENLDEHAERLLRIIRWQAETGDPEVGLRWVSELMQRAHQVEQFNVQSIQELGGSLAGDRSLFVLGHIEPSGDRVIREINKLYRPLVEVPTPLAGIPDLHGLLAHLDEAFPWFAPLNQWVARELSVKAQGFGTFHLRPKLLLGPHGTGKTSWSQELAKASGVPFVSIGIAGQTDNKVLEATSRGWSSANVCRPLESIRQYGFANPIFLLDEIDKPGTGRHNGHVWDSLLKLFEPANARRFYDECLQGHADLSHITWICTANDASRLPAALLDRLEVFEVDYPEPEHYPGIVARTLRDFQARHGLHDAMMPKLGEAEWAWLQKFFSSPRKTRKAVEKLITLLMSIPKVREGVH